MILRFDFKFLFFQTVVRLVFWRFAQRIVDKRSTQQQFLCRFRILIWVYIYFEVSTLSLSTHLRSYIHTRVRFYKLFLFVLQKNSNFINLFNCNFSILIQSRFCIRYRFVVLFHRIIDLLKFNENLMNSNSVFATRRELCCGATVHLPHFHIVRSEKSIASISKSHPQFEIKLWKIINC